MNPVVEIRGLPRAEGHGEERHYNQGKWWNMSRLIELSKQLPVFEVQLAALDLARMPWKLASVWEFIFHVRRCQECSLEHPVILAEDGHVMNGWHRIARAVLEHRATLPAVRFVDDPEPDGSE